MASPMKSYLTIDAGGTFLKSAVLSQTGEVFHESSLSVKSYSGGSREKILQTFSNVISKGISFIKEKGMEPGGIGIAFPGPFNFEKGIPLMHHKFSEIYGVNLREFIYELPDITENIPVGFIHDANAVLAGELWKGNAIGFANSVIVTLGTGLGSAISIDGKVLCNEMGGPYLSMFRIPYKDGILEDYTAKRGFLKIYYEISRNPNIKKIKVSDIGRQANEGDKSSVQTFRKVGQILAEALQSILENKNIECLLFGGQISRSFCHIEPSLLEGLRDVKCLKQILPVKNIDNAALYGALTTVISKDQCIENLQ